METAMQPQSLNEEKLVPIDTSGDNVEVELKEEKKEEKVNDTNVEVQEEKPQSIVTGKQFFFI